MIIIYYVVLSIDNKSFQGVEHLNVNIMVNGKIFHSSVIHLQVKCDLFDAHVRDYDLLPIFPQQVEIISDNGK